MKQSSNKKSREATAFLYNQQLRQLVSSTCEKLARISDQECIRLMADIRAAYKERNLELIRQRQKAAQRKPAMRKRKRSLER